MKIKILYFDPIADGTAKKGKVDFKIEYNNDKWEIFRGCVYFIKGDKKWISPGVVKRDEKFLQRYERSPSFGKIVHEVVKELDSFIESNPTTLTTGLSLDEK